MGDVLAGHIYIAVGMSVCLSVRLPVCLSVVTLLMSLVVACRSVVHG